MSTLAYPSRVLLVEDNYDHAELVRRSFLRYEVSSIITHVDNGETALEYIQSTLSNNPAELPQLILLDLRLPRMDGLTLLGKLKNDSVLSRIPIVILTSSASRLDIEAALENHANSYLVKPLEVKGFNKLVEEIAEYWLKLNAMPFAV